VESFIKRDKGGKNPQEKTQKKGSLTIIKGYNIREEGDKIILEIAIIRELIQT